MPRSRRHLAVAAIVAFFAWGYVVQWVPLLRWAGYGFVAAIVLCLLAVVAAVLLSARLPAVAVRVCVPAGLAINRREVWAAELEALHRLGPHVRQPLYPQSAAISAAVDDLLDLISRQFVRSWYQSISRHSSFPDEVDRLIRQALCRLRDCLRDCLTDLDLTHVLTQHLVPLLTAHVRDFNDAERAIRGQKLNRAVTESDELDLAVASKFRHGTLHPAASLLAPDTRLAQQDHLRAVASRLLARLLPANLVASRVVSAVMRELVACAVLLPLMQLLSDPDTWNQLMESYGRSMLHDRSTVRKLRAALDAHASPSPTFSPRPATIPRFGPGDSDRRFERFIRAIRKTNNLSDARRFRSQVASQLKRDGRPTDRQPDSQPDAQPDPVYLRRLDIAKKLLDQRVSFLTAGGDVVGPIALPPPPPPPSSRTQALPPSLRHADADADADAVPALPRFETGTVLDVLRDPAGLSYFMEYMDRQHLLPLVQFWLVVDGLRNPLEDEDEDDGQDDKQQDLLPSTPSVWTASDRADLEQIEQSYFSRPESGFAIAAGLSAPGQDRGPDIGQDIGQDIRHFLAAGPAATPPDYHRARRAVLTAQRAVLREMDKRHFIGFKKSDLFFKCLASREASASSAAASWSHLPAAAVATTTTAAAAASTAIQAKAPSRLPTSLSSSSLSPTPRPQPPVPLRGKSTNPRVFVHGSGSGGPDSLALPPAVMANSRRSVDEDGSSSSFLHHRHHPDTGRTGEKGEIGETGETGETGNADAGLADSVQSLDAPSIVLLPDLNVVRAIEQALSTILTDDRPQTAASLRASLFGSDDGADHGLFGDTASTAEATSGGAKPADRWDKSTEQMDQPTDLLDKPSLASLGLVSGSSAGAAVFEKDDLFGDEDQYLPAQDAADNAADGDDGADQVHEAAPGDLILAETITALANDINRLAAQDAVIDSLTRKAELTNNTTELRILRKSKASLQRELRRKELQRRQYVMQETDNSLFGRSTVRIRSTRVGRTADGKDFVLYAVDVQRDGGEQMPAATWTVTRRYSQFHELHQRLRDCYPSVRSLDFPPRRVVMKFQTEFLRKRRHALEAYLCRLLLLPEVCRSRELRAFLSQSPIAVTDSSPGNDRDGQKDMITRLYHSVTDGMDDWLGNIAVLDHLSVASQQLFAAATSQLGSSSSSSSYLPFLSPSIVSTTDDSTGPTAVAEAERELSAYESAAGTGHGTGTGTGSSGSGSGSQPEPFIKPICDIFLELFELNRGNNWLRGRAVVMVLQQLLGGTVERKIRDFVHAAVLAPDAVLRLIALARPALLRPASPAPPRTPAQRAHTRTEASLMLATLVPDLAAGVVGRANAQAAGRRIFATLNNARLNSHLAYTLLDQVVALLFDDPAERQYGAEQDECSDLSGPGQRRVIPLRPVGSRKDRGQ